MKPAGAEKAREIRQEQLLQQEIIANKLSQAELAKIKGLKKGFPTISPDLMKKYDKMDKEFYENRQRLFDKAKSKLQQSPQKMEAKKNPKKDRKKYFRI